MADDLTPRTAELIAALRDQARAKYRRILADDDDAEECANRVAEIWTEAAAATGGDISSARGIVALRARLSCGVALGASIEEWRLEARALAIAEFERGLIGDKVQ